MNAILQSIFEFFRKTKWHMNLMGNYILSGHILEVLCI